MSSNSKCSCKAIPAKGTQKLNFEKIVEEAKKQADKYFKDYPDQKRVWVDPYSDGDYDNSDPYPGCDTFDWHSDLLERYQRLIGSAQQHNDL